MSGQYIGLNNQNGRNIADDEHLAQSIKDILTTPIGSRVMRRDYGSYLFRLIDYCANEKGQILVVAAVADALMKWEPRIQIDRIQISSALNGQTQVILDVTKNQNSKSELTISL